MRSFDALTEPGQAGRLRSTCEAVLRQRGVTRCRLHLIASSFNTLFRVDADGQAPFVLRVSPELRIHPVGTEGLEAEWTAQVREDTDVRVSDRQPVHLVRPHRLSRRRLPPDRRPGRLT